MTEIVDLNSWKNGHVGAAQRMICEASAAAVGLIPLEVFHEQPSVRIAGDLANLEDYRHNAHRPGAWVQAALVVTDAHLAGRFKIPLFGPNGDRAVIGSAVNISKDVLGKPRPDARRPDRVLPDAALIGGRGGGTYGHWLLDFIPQLITVLRVGELHGHEHPILVANCPTFAVRMIAHLGVRDRCIFLKPNEQVQVERLTLPLITKHGARYSSRVLANCFSRLCPTPPKSVGRKLLVGRRKPPFVSNFDELRTKMSGLGFETIFPEDLPMEAQFRLFQSADVVVGEDGSAMHNAGFCVPGGHMVVYSRGAKVNYWHAAVAEAAGLSLTYLQSSPDRDGYTAPIEAICTALAEL